MGLGVGCGMSKDKKVLYLHRAALPYFVLNTEIFYNIVFEKRSYAIIFKYGNHCLKVIFNFFKHL